MSVIAEATLLKIGREIKDDPDDGDGDDEHGASACCGNGFRYHRSRAIDHFYRVHLERGGDPFDRPIYPPGPTSEPALGISDAPEARPMHKERESAAMVERPGGVLLIYLTARLAAFNGQPERAAIPGIARGRYRRSRSTLHRPPADPCRPPESV